MGKISLFGEAVVLTKDVSVLPDGIYRIYRNDCEHPCLLTFHRHGDNRTYFPTIDPFGYANNIPHSMVARVERIDLDEVRALIQFQADLISDLKDDRGVVYVVENRMEYEGGSVVAVCFSLAEARRAVEADADEEMWSGESFVVTAWRGNESTKLCVFAGNRWVCIDCGGESYFSKTCTTCNGTGKPT